MKTAHIKISEVADEYFRYKGRKWYCGAYLPWLGKYEIHTVTGDRCTTIEPDTLIDVYL